MTAFQSTDRQLVASLDDTDGDSVDVRHGFTADWRRCVDLHTRANVHPHTSSGLTPATARALARHLIEAADEAERRQQLDDHDHDGPYCWCYQAERDHQRAAADPIPAEQLAEQVSQ